ncbi:MAG: phosphatase PAP2-related protein [Candidatus Parcubacteria bacterium]|nr:phosphatase PAP2-related protein [Candidatus Parcubacteria bacterium]
MGQIIKNNKDFWTDTQALFAAFISSLFLGLSLVANFYAGIYATMKASNPVTDIILDNIRVYDVDAIFIYGPVVLWAFVAILCFNQPKRIPFVLKSVALFIFTRSFFITLTHIGPSIEANNLVDYSSRIIKDFTFGGDLFFSAHTGLPFLMALVFAKDMRLLVLFTLTAIFFGIIVLMGHLHYTIDVIAAFFITYTIYTLAKYFFKKDWEMFNRS